jgi:L-lactate dehydrogenase complex protein LldG
MARSENARSEVLVRIRRALADRPGPPEIARDYRGSGELILTDPVATFSERLTDYRARVLRAGAERASLTIDRALRDSSVNRVVVPTDLPPDLLESVTAQIIYDTTSLTVADLDAIDGVITTCACAIALTGTIVLDAGAGQGRRALTLVPDYHLVVVRGDQIVAGVPDAVAVLDPTRPLTWISGPSATSDIELNRVEGVHGPRRLEVLIVDG